MRQTGEPCQIKNSAPFQSCQATLKLCKSAEKDCKAGDNLEVTHEQNALFQV